MHIKCAIGCGRQQYQIDKVLGEGAFGVVYEASSLNSGAKVAMKEISTYGGCDLTILRELTLMRHLQDCPNVPRIFGVLSSPNGSSAVLMMELLDMDLERWLDRVPALPQDAFEIRHVKLLLYQLLGALYWMHRIGVVHCDVKLANLLLYKECFLKLCDLGECALYDERRYRRNGTFLQCAPELLLTTAAYCPAADVWNVGLIFQQLLAALYRVDAIAVPETYDFDPESVLSKILCITGVPAGGEPLDGQHGMNSSGESAGCDLRDFEEFDLSAVVSFTAALEKQRADAPRSPFNWVREWGMDAHAADLLTKLLKFNPADRIGVAQALQHPLFVEDKVFMREIHIMGVAVDFQREHPLFVMPESGNAAQQLQQLLVGLESETSIDVDEYYQERRTRVGKMLVSPLVVPEDVTRTAAAVSAMIIKRTSMYRKSSAFGGARGHANGPVLSPPGMGRCVTFSDGLDGDSLSPLMSPSSKGFAMPRSRSIVTLA